MTFATFTKSFVAYFLVSSHFDMPFIFKEKWQRGKNVVMFGYL
jgi:hypothetical protein